MSNPGVIVLSEKKLGNGRFVVEDNIGEAIHLHYNDIRVDLTVKDYFNLCNSVERSLDGLIEIEDFDLKNFDPKFLDMISDYLLNLESVEFKKVKLMELKVKTYAFGVIPVMRKLNKSRVYKALCGNTKEEENYEQENYRGQTNLGRVQELYSSVKEHGYPYDNKYIVLFNSQMAIRDGQHRAAALLFEHGNIDVDVLVLKFKNNKYNVSMHPWLFSIFVLKPRNLRKILRRIKNVLRKVYHKLRGV